MIPARDWLAELAEAEREKANRLSLAAVTVAKSVKTAKSPLVHDAEVPFGAFGAFGKSEKTENNGSHAARSPAGIRTIGDSSNNGDVSPVRSTTPAGVPEAWVQGFARLDPNRPPKGFPATWWREVIRDGELFLARWARQAADLGWSELDVFGCHKTAPSANYAAMGLTLLTRGGRVVALSAETAIIEQASGSRLTFTRRPNEREAVPIWELRRP
jgi:hypothetical protein